METKTCSNCGHENLGRAVFCFQCGFTLDQPPVVRGIHHRRRHVEEAIRYAQEREDSLEPDLVQRLRAAKAKLPPSIDETPVTCLRCGTLNHPRGSYCVGCGSTLSVPDDVDRLNLVPRTSARTSVGRVRENNEDRVGQWARHGVVLALVADGMGGAVAGEEASRLVVEAVQADFLGEARGSETLFDLTEDEVSEKLRLAVRRANRAVMERADDHPELHGMGTTMTLAFVRDNRVIIAHVGDSRAYLVDGHEGWINQITDDHSFVEALLSSGHITPEQAAVHPMRNVLYRALGQVDDTDADLYSRSLTEGDRLILCSDGLTRHVSSAEIAAIAITSDAPDAIAHALIDLANERGGEDNISAVVVLMERAKDVKPEEPPSPTILAETTIGLHQAQPVADDDTKELPMVEPTAESPPENGESGPDESALDERIDDEP
ncbi:MAG: Stp1/IreP family PP2C-type Ser/Thr phosphatase [Anaerolineae bacterium]|nr:Stp1/IreP family PP2C-type Ser/Thr phosphatase [Anaerolineae bacterium]